jgi:hypothetical protein
MLLLYSYYTELPREANSGYIEALADNWCWPDAGIERMEQTKFLEYSLLSFHRNFSEFSRIRPKFSSRRALVPLH